MLAVPERAGMILPVFLATAGNAGPRRCQAGILAGWKHNLKAWRATAQIHLDTSSINIACSETSRKPRCRSPAITDAASLPA